MTVSMLMLAACNKGDVTTTPAPDPEVFEFEYEVTDAGGDCDTLHRADGTGVLAIVYDRGLTAVCTTRDLCDGEFCRIGIVLDDVFIYNEIFSVVPDPDIDCRVLVNVSFDLIDRGDGSLEGTTRELWAYDSGDCEMTLPCERWQEIVVTECDPGCYEALCGSAASTRAARASPSAM